MSKLENQKIKILDYEREIELKKEIVDLEGDMKDYQKFYQEGYGIEPVEIWDKKEEIENFNIKDTDKYPVMPLRNTVLFPQQVIPIYIGRDRSLKLINELDPKKRYIVVVAQEDGSIDVSS